MKPKKINFEKCFLKKYNLKTGLSKNKFSKLLPQNCILKDSIFKIASSKIHL